MLPARSRPIALQFLLFIFVSVAALPYSARAQAGRASIEGRLVTQEGAAVAGERIIMLPANQVTTSDADGAFRFSLLSAGTYSLRVIATGFLATEVAIAVTEDAPSRVTIRLRPVPTLGAVSIRDRARSYAGPLSNIGARAPIPARELPFTIQSVTRDVIDERQQLTIREATRMLPGVLPGRNATNELVIRGFNDNGGVQNFSAFGSNFAVNGMRNYAGSYASDVLLVNAERVEVVKGASGVLYGFNHPGGMINIVTKRPTIEPLRRFDASAGNWGRFRLEADISDQLSAKGNLKYRLSAGYFTSPDWRQANYNRTAVIAPVVTYELSPRTRGSLEFVLSRTQRAAWYDWGVPARDATGRDISGVVSSQYTSAQIGDATLLGTAATFATIEHDLTPTLLWRTETSFSNNTIDHNGHYPQFSRALPNATGDVGLQYRLYNGENAGTFATSYLAQTFAHGNIKHRLVVGTDLLNGDTRGRESSASNNTANPANVAPMNVITPQFAVRQTGNYVFTGGYNKNVTVRQLGLYAQDFVDVGSRLKLLAGVRLDRFRTREEIGAAEGENTPVVWNLGATLALPANSFAYVSSTSSFQPQVISDPTAGGPFDALQGQQIELGVRSESGDGTLRGGANIYRIVRRNELVSANDPDNENRLQQLGETQSDGAEFELTGRVSGWLSLQSWYAYNFARPTVADDESLLDKRLPNAPAHSGALWARFSPAGERWASWSANIGVTAVSERLGGRERTPYAGYTVLDAALSWRSDGLALSANVNNLTDVRYLSGIWSDFYTQRGAPRNVMLRLSIDL